MPEQNRARNGVCACAPSGPLPSLGSAGGGGGALRCLRSRGTDISESAGRLLRGEHLRGRAGERWSLVGRGTLGSRRLTVGDAT